MERFTHNVVQNSPEWHAFRANHFGASEAAAMMGVSPYTTRDALLRQKATGEAEEVSPQLQKVFDRGHETEIGGRALAEGILGDELFPVTMSYGKLSASCDGLTMDAATAFEHKQWNEELAESIGAGILPDHHKPQCQQVMHVTGATKLLFMVSDGTADNCEWMYVDYDPYYCARLSSAWAQFQADLNAYTPPEVTRPAVAAPQETLPAVTVQVSGSLAIIDNLSVFGEALKAYVARINQKPETDDDFATLEQQAKDLKKAEDALTAAENGALAQAASVDEMRRAVAGYREIARHARLTAEKVVKAEKENRKNAIVQAGNTALREFLDRVLIAPPDWPMAMPVLSADFASATRGLKTLTSIKNAVNTELARVKILAGEEARKIAGNLQTIAQAGSRHLFADYKALALKAPDDLRAVIAQRLAEAKAAEEKRVEAERERIAVEERAKLSAAQSASPSLSHSENPITNVAAAPAVNPAPMPQPLVDLQVNESARDKLIREFIASREWKRGEDTKARAVIVEFMNFCDGARARKAA